MGALLGPLATGIALLAFHLWNSPLQDLGGDSFVDNVRLELAANRGYLEGGLVTGPLFGALGAWWRKTRSLRASVVAGALLMAEPLVLLVLGTAVPSYSAPGGLPQVLRLVPGWGLGSETSSISLGVYVTRLGSHSGASFSDARPVGKPTERCRCSSSAIRRTRGGS
jgi:hypothetical protein